MPCSCGMGADYGCDGLMSDPPTDRFKPWERRWRHLCND
jgi:hypothetical protein